MYRPKTTAQMAPALACHRQLALPCPRALHYAYSQNPPAALTHGGAASMPRRPPSPQRSLHAPLFVL